MRRVLGLALTAAAMLVGADSAAALGRQSPGYVYYHKAGATLASLQAAMLPCDLAARKTIGVQAAGGYTGALPSLMQRPFDLNQVQSNVETCMVVAGWSVVRIPDAEGAALLDGPPAALNSWLAAQTGAAQPRGQVVRRYDPAAPVIYDMSDMGGAPRDSLSYRAVFGKNVYTVLPKDRVQPRELVLVPRAARPAGLPPDTSLIVVRTHGVRPGQQINVRFMSVIGGSEKAPQLAIFATPSPTKMFWKAGTPMEDTFVFEVTPGRWILMGDNVASYCLGAPSFRVGEGEVVFAGTFSSETIGDTQPKMDLAPVRAALSAAPGVAERLKPAVYENGLTFDCGLWGGTLINAFEVKGAAPLPPRVVEPDAPVVFN